VRKVSMGKHCRKVNEPANFTNQFRVPDGFDRFLGIINIPAPVDDRLVNQINKLILNPIAALASDDVIPESGLNTPLIIIK